jgi:hypothetical protein
MNIVVVGNRNGQRYKKAVWVNQARQLLNGIVALARVTPEELHQPTDEPPEELFHLLPPLCCGTAGARAAGYVDAALWLVRRNLGKRLEP